MILDRAIYTKVLGMLHIESLMAVELQISSVHLHLDSGGKILTYKPQVRIVPLSQ